MAWISTATGWGQSLEYPPRLPHNAEIVEDQSSEFLRAPTSLVDGVVIAKTPPRVELLYYPEQTYPGNPWSVWGDSLAVGTKYYSAIGDHRAPHGNAFVFEYDSVTRKLRTLVNVDQVLGLPKDHYSPAKIHSRLDMGHDGWLYFSTHRGSTRVTTDQYHYQGDWILRHHPERGVTEIVVHAPVPKHCIPTSVLDPDRLIFYGGTAAGDPADKTVMFFAYDIPNRRVRVAVPDGPYRYLLFARSTGRVYYCNEDEGPLMRYDPETDRAPQEIPARLGLRAATQETAEGYVYTVSSRGDAPLWRFNTHTETAERLGSAVVGSQSYITSLDVDPSGRYIYYVPGAHGGGYRDGSPIVQYDTKTGIKKVLAFLYPRLQEAFGYAPLGTYAVALSPDGATLYITWNGNRGGADRRGRLAFDTCALTVIHIPESERP